MGTTDGKRCPPAGTGITDGYRSQGVTGWAQSILETSGRNQKRIQGQERQSWCTDTVIIEIAYTGNKDNSSAIILQQSNILRDILKTSSAFFF